MSDLYDQVTADQDPFKRLASKLPGFSGYIERQNRRAADKLLREAVADRFTEIRKRVGDLQQDLASDQELEYIDDLETAATKMMTFIDKISRASYGNSSFFEAVKINEEELARLYEYDLALMDMADQIGSAVDNVEKSVGEEGLPAAISHLVTLSRELVSAFEAREQVITQQEPGG